MDSTLLLQPNLYPRVTPAGAYYAVSNKGQSASRTLLGGILQAGEQETVSRENVLRWAQTNDIDAALNLLYRMQRLEFCMVKTSRTKNRFAQRYRPAQYPDASF